MLDIALLVIGVLALAFAAGYGRKARKEYAKQLDELTALRRELAQLQAEQRALDAERAAIRRDGSRLIEGLGPWVACPRQTQWGAGMVEALVAVTKDETARVIATEEAAPMVADAIVVAVRKPLTLEQCRALVVQHFEHGELCGDDVTLIRAVERAHGIGA